MKLGFAITPLSAMDLICDGFVSYIEVNGPKEDLKGSALTAPAPEFFPKATGADASDDASELPELLPRWAIFSEALQGREASAEPAEPKKSGRPGGFKATLGRYGKCLWLPEVIVEELYKSHLAQKDELFALRSLYEKRLINLQKQEYLKVTWDMLERLANVWHSMLSLKSLPIFSTLGIDS